MSMIIELNSELEDRLGRIADQRGIDPSACVLAMLEEQLTREEEEPLPTNGHELVAYWRKAGLVGDWADRKDISDSSTYAQSLREQAEFRHGG